MLTRTEHFALRLTPEEARALEALAAHEERTASDVVRRLIRAAAATLAKKGTKPARKWATKRSP